MSRDITAKQLEDFLQFFNKGENFFGLCQAVAEYEYGSNYIGRYIRRHIPMSAIYRMESNLPTYEAHYWWKSGDKEPRIKFLESHIKALKMNPISRWFYYIYLHLTL